MSWSTRTSAGSATARSKSSNDDGALGPAHDARGERRASGGAEPPREAERPGRKPSGRAFGRLPGGGGRRGSAWDHPHGERRGFFGGGDLSRFERDWDPAEFRAQSHELTRLISAVERLEKPVVAAINGLATGA
ncbi:MAG: hypothetical protein CYG60_00840, partial [Actinobacteria bacterium]